MEMFFTLVALSLLTTVVSAALFLAAARTVPTARRGKSTSPALPARFFAEAVHVGTAQVPIEVLLLQIERHVRLEEAAAESFVNLPTREVLHSRTASPLVH
jgi:hypothetical protein